MACLGQKPIKKDCVASSSVVMAKRREELEEHHDDSWRPSYLLGRSDIDYRDSFPIPHDSSRRMLDPTANPFVFSSPIAHHNGDPFSVFQPATHANYHQQSQPTWQPDDEGRAAFLSGAATPPLETVIRMWRSKLSQIALLRDRVLSIRAEVKPLKYHRDRFEKRFEKITEDIVGTAKNTQDINLKRCHELSRLFEELKDCNIHLEPLRERVSKLEDNLSNHEYQLQRAEENLYLELDNESRRKDLSDEMRFQENTAPTARPSDHGNEESTDLRDRLYSRMGDLRIHHERLNNFEDDLREELEERDFMRASGQFVTTDHVFFEQTEAERLGIQQDLREAQADVEDLKNQCAQNGIEFEEPHFMDMIGHAKTESFAADFDALTHKPEELTGSSSIIGAFFNVQERIKRWLNQPLQEDMDLNPEQGEMEVEPEERMRRASESSDMVWVPRPNQIKRTVSMEAAGKHGSAARDTPEWRYGPRPGSSLLEALLLESAATPLGTYENQPAKARLTLYAGLSLPGPENSVHLTEAMQDAEE